MANRTYRYFRGEPLFPFGHGLSYTRFEYGPLGIAGPRLSRTGKTRVRVTVRNAGARDGEEVVQLYVRRTVAKPGDPIRSLAAFRRVAIPKGASREVVLELPASALRRWDVAKREYVVDPGAFTVEVGASSGDLRRSVKMELR